MIDEKLLTEILKATKDGNLSWLNVGGQDCCQATYAGSVYIICKYNLMDGQSEVSFNKCDSYGHIISPFREFSSDHKLFSLLEDIYELAWQNKSELV